MPDFDPNAPVIVEKTSEIGKQRRYSFKAGTFNKLEDVEDYLDMISTQATDTGTYEIRQPVSTVEIETDQMEYTGKEVAKIDQAKNEFAAIPGVINVSKITNTVFEWTLSRPPYETQALGNDFDFYVTVDSSDFDFETVETQLTNSIQLETEVFFEGKTQRFDRGNQTPTEYSVFFTVEREYDSVENQHHLYQQLRKHLSHIEEIQSIIKIAHIRIGTTHGYVEGEPYPEDTILIDIGTLSNEPSFMDDVVFTKEKTEREAFGEIKEDLQKHTKLSKAIYSDHILDVVENLPFTVNVLGAGEYSSGTTTRLVLGLSAEEEN